MMMTRCPSRASAMAKLMTKIRLPHAAFTAGDSDDAGLPSAADHRAKDRRRAPVFRDDPTAKENRLCHQRLQSA